MAMCASLAMLAVKASTSNISGHCDTGTFQFLTYRKNSAAIVELVLTRIRTEKGKQSDEETNRGRDVG